MTHKKKSKRSFPASSHHKLQASNKLTHMKKSNKITDFYKSNKKITNKEDRLSSLPDSLIVSILSLLPIHTAAATSLLSHHWRYLWTQTTSFSNYLRSRNHDHYTCQDSLGKFVPIVNHIFKQLTSPTIHTFDILVPNFHKISEDQLKLCESALGTWVLRVCEANVTNIYVNNDDSPTLFDEPETVLLLPTCVFQCRSLVSLRIGQKFRIKLPDDGVINLPNLKKLTLKVVDWDCETMSTLFKSCPMLESLDLDISCVEKRRLVEISCHSLRSLTLRGEHNNSIGWNYVLDTPSLVFVSASFVCYRFDNVATNYGFAYLFKGLLHGIRSINFLEVNSYMLWPLSICDCNFANLSKLDVSLDNTAACGNLIRYLHRVPSLEILVIQQNFDKKEGLDYWVLRDYFTVPTCLSSKLKKVEVTYPHEKKEDLKLLEYILRNGHVLETVSIKVWSLDRGQIGRETHHKNNKIKNKSKNYYIALSPKYRVCEKLFSFPWSPETCVIHMHVVNGRYGKDLTASSRLY